LEGSKQIECARLDLYKRKEEITVENSKIDDENNNLLQSQQGLIDQLEQQLTKIQSERDRLFKAHSHEIVRADELQNKLDDVQENIHSESVVESQSKTIVYPLTPSENIIYHPNGYVTYEGKLMNLNALLELRPDLKSASDSFNQINFGPKFAKYAKIGDIFIKTDLMPHTVFKFNGQKWIEIDKKLNRSYLHDVSYIQFLIDKLETGEYDADLLTDDEREEIASHLQSK
jgi:hypothetical protein